MRSRSWQIEPLPLGGGSRDSLVSGVWQDIRFGARLLAKEPATALVIVVTLALAIAANTIVSGFTDLFILRPLSIGNTERLVTIYSINAQHGQDRQPVSVPDFLDIKAQSASFEDLSAMSREQLSLTGLGEPRAIQAAYVTATPFRVWDVPAFKGRTFLPGEDQPARSQVAVLSHRFGTSYFADAGSAIESDHHAERTQLHRRWDPDASD